MRGHPEVPAVPRNPALEPIAQIARTREAVELPRIDDELRVDAEAAHRLIHLLGIQQRHVEILVTTHEQRRRHDAIRVQERKRVAQVHVDVLPRKTQLRLVLADVLWLAGIAIAVTLPVAILLSRMVRSQLYNVSPADPVVLIMGTVMVAFVALLSALLPARRAATVEPMKALRTE